MDQQRVFDVLLNDKLATLIRGLLLEIGDNQRLRGLLLDDVLSLQMLFRISNLQVRNLNLDLRKFAHVVFAIFFGVIVILHRFFVVRSG